MFVAEGLNLGFKISGLRILGVEFRIGVSESGFWA